MSATLGQYPIDQTKSVNWRQHVSREEISELVRMRDGRAWLTVAVNWAVVFGAMALVANWPNLLTVIVALFLIGARQLGCAVIMHDASHHAFLSDRGVNDWVGNWLAAYPVWSDLHSYRPYHLKHHAHTWTENDPDVALAMPFPITVQSFGRKVLRDLSGRTGLKFARFAIRRDFGSEGTLRERWLRAIRSPRFRGMLITNAVLLGLVSAAGQPALYLLWVGAYLTTNTLVTRIRAIAEHSMVTDPGDELMNTRTTVVSWWERLFFAPISVNYHLEHHLLMTVPHYNLRRLHALLKSRGVLDDALVSQGYAEVLRRATSLEPAPTV
jgi:fatty acid desaturase